MFREADVGAGGGGGSGESAASAPAPTIISTATQPGAAAAPAVSTPSESKPVHINPDGSFGEGWTSALLPEELGDARTGFAKFKTVAELGKAYHGLEQKLGKGANAAYVPGEGATPEEVSAYRKAVGVPETADGYRIKPDKLPEGINWDDARVKPLLELAHKHNVPESALKDFAAWDMERETSRAAAEIEAHNKRVEEATGGLKQLWGDQFGDRITKVQQMATIAGIDPFSPGLADPEVVKAFARFSDLISDDKFVKSGASPLLTGTESAKDIMTNKANPLYEKYQNGDPDTVERVRSMLKRG